MLMNYSQATTAAAPGMIPPRLIVKAVSDYAETFFTPLDRPKNRIENAARSRILPLISFACGCSGLENAGGLQTAEPLSVNTGSFEIDTKG
ncbi:MAG: hypothetical protein HEQ23_01860 [Tepidisphaera sp.]